jgi:hypothetical protein
MDIPRPQPARSERGWGKLLVAIGAFLFVPMIPQLQAFLPVEQTLLLFVPAVAACALVGWWAGGRPYMAIVWVLLAAFVTAQPAAPPNAFYNLARGWSLLLAGAFGLVCLLDVRRPLFTRSLTALGITVLVAGAISLLGPVTMSRAASTVRNEYERRNAGTLAAMNTFIESHPTEWRDFIERVPIAATLPAETDKQLHQISNAGLAVFPALLALQSLIALALGWATYHRLGRARLGAPLGALKEFRFNDQFVWGLIVGLTIALLPTLTSLKGLGRNLLVFFGALYAMRGLGVLSWFMAPATFAISIFIGFVTIWWPPFAVLAFMLISVTALALGLGDTWADWRSRARSPM